MNNKAILIGIVILMVLPNIISATTYTVCSSGCDYTTIQAAEIAAGTGDTVYIYNGTYNENVNINTAHLTIQGEGRDVVHVFTTSNGFTIGSSYTNITGINITGPATSNACIMLNGNFDYCNFSYNRVADAYLGIVVRGAGNDHNLVLNNTVTGISNTGIMVRDTSYTNVTQNYLTYNMYSIMMRDGSTSCYCFHNWVKHGTGYGLWQYGTSTDLTFYNNWVENCTRMASGGTIGTVWHVTKRSGTNIFGGNYIGGNYWDDYTGVDNDGDGLGNTAIPYTNGGNITNGGDSNPLCIAAGGEPSSPRNCACGDICVNTTHWWRDDAPINSSSNPMEDGIAAAISYQTIYIFNGSYTENIAESDTSHLTVKGEGRGVVHVTPTVTDTDIFFIGVDANHFNISGVHGHGGTGVCGGVHFNHVTHGNVTDCNFSNSGFGVWGEHGNYIRVVGNILCDNGYRGSTFPYYANNSYFADNIIMNNSGRGLDICTHGDNSTFKNNTVLYNGIDMVATHFSGINTHWGNNILYDECRSYGNYGYRDHLIRNDANNITIRNPASIIGEALDFDIEDNDCEWKIENTDGQIFTETSSATAYAYPMNFSMRQENVAGTFTVILTPMTLLSTDDPVTVTSISYNNAIYSENYNITADCTDTSETVTYTAAVVNSSHYYKCYVDGVYDSTIQAVGGVVTWEYTDGFTTPHTLAILWESIESDLVVPTPTDLITTTGNFWVRHVWSAGIGVITDSYNVSVNDIWYNTSSSQYYNTYISHNWQNITIFAYNNSNGGTLSINSIGCDTQIPNNAVTLHGIFDWYTSVGTNIIIECNGIDADSDTLIFSCNRTDLFSDFNTNTGAGNWTSLNGTYCIDFGVSDNYGSIDNCTIIISTDIAPPSNILERLSELMAAIPTILAPIPSIILVMVEIMCYLAVGGLVVGILSIIIVQLSINKKW